MTSDSILKDTVALIKGKRHFYFPLLFISILILGSYFSWIYQYQVLLKTPTNLQDHYVVLINNPFLPLRVPLVKSFLYPWIAYLVKDYFLLKTINLVLLFFSSFITLLSSFLFLRLNKESLSCSPGRAWGDWVALGFFFLFLNANSLPEVSANIAPESFVAFLFALLLLFFVLAFFNRKRMEFFFTFGLGVSLLLFLFKSLFLIVFFFMVILCLGLERKRHIQFSRFFKTLKFVALVLIIGTIIFVDKYSFPQGKIYLSRHLFYLNLPPILKVIEEDLRTEKDLKKREEILVIKQIVNDLLLLPPRDDLYPNIPYNAGAFMGRPDYILEALKKPSSEVRAIHLSYYFRAIYKYPLEMAQKPLSELRAFYKAAHSRFIFHSYDVNPIYEFLHYAFFYFVFFAVFLFWKIFTKQGQVIFVSVLCMLSSLIIAFAVINTLYYPRFSVQFYPLYYFLFFASFIVVGALTKKILLSIKNTFMAFL